MALPTQTLSRKTQRTATLLFLWRATEGACEIELPFAQCRKRGGMASKPINILALGWGFARRKGVNMQAYRKPHLRWLFWLLQASGLLMLFAILWAGPFNAFVLAPDFLTNNQILIIPACIAMGIFGSWINTVAGFAMQPKRAAAISGFIVFAMLFYFTLAHTYPMLWTQAYGQRGGLVYTVEDPQAAPRKGCQHGRVTVISGPDLMRAEICNVPEALRNALKEGDQIRVLGKASVLGVFFTSFQRVNG